VVKGNAYGHGIENTVSIAEGAGIRHFSTFSTDEAFRVLKSSKKNSQIMIMGMVDNASLPFLVEQGISFYVFELDRLLSAIEAAKTLGKKPKYMWKWKRGFTAPGLNGERKMHWLRF
jgi:alanine racemase